MSEARIAPAESENLWDAKDVARYVKGSVSWVYKAAEAGILPSVRIGSMLRFEPAAVRSFVRDPRGNAKVR
jgi:hypothetical protein